MESAVTEIEVQKYEVYKESGVAWLGDIPAHWDVVRSKALFQERKEKARKEDMQLTASQKYGMISQEEYMEREGRRVTVVFLDRDILKHTEANDFIISMRSFQGGLEYSAISGCVSSAYIPLIPIKHVVPEFFKYLFKSDGYIKTLSSTSNLVRDGQAMRFENFAAVPLLIVPVTEQTAIANFLDRKTAQIDQAIAQKESLIELLQERRQILIQRAVTRGLNPDVPMKDSGVEWIGKIPAHWRPVKMKYLTEFIYDGTHGSYPRSDEGFRLLSVRNIVDNKFVFREDDSLVAARHFKEISSKFLVREDDIQLAIVGATLGKAAMVEAVDKPFVTQRSIATIRVEKKSVWPIFLLNYIRSESFQKYLWLNASFSAQPGVYLGTIQDSTVPTPPIQEQFKIATYIGIISNGIDAAISCKKREIGRLHEYKSTLINATVTGKIKVC